MWPLNLFGEKRWSIESDDIHSALVRDEKGQPVYASETRKTWTGDVTTFVRGDGAIQLACETTQVNAKGKEKEKDEIVTVVVRINRNTKEIIYQNGATRKTYDFLVEIVVSERERHGSFSDSSGRRYTWKSIDGDAKRTLELYADGSILPVAQFEPAILEGSSARAGVLRMSNFSISRHVVDNESFPLDGRILVTLLIIIHARRKHRGSWTPALRDGYSFRRGDVDKSELIIDIAKVVVPLVLSLMIGVPIQTSN